MKPFQLNVTLWESCTSTRFSCIKNATTEAATDGKTFQARRGELWTKFFTRCDARWTIQNAFVPFVALTDSINSSDSCCANFWTLPHIRDWQQGSQEDKVQMEITEGLVFHLRCRLGFFSCFVDGASPNLCRTIDIVKYCWNHILRQQLDSLLLLL